MNWTSQLTRTPYIVLFVILGTVGISAVYATSTFQSGGNAIDGSVPVIIDGNLVVNGDEASLAFSVFDGNTRVVRDDNAKIRNVLKNLDDQDIRFTFNNVPADSKFFIELEQGGDVFAIVDATANEPRIQVFKNGTICIGAC